MTLLRLVFKARLGGGVWCDHPRRGSLLRNLMGWFDKIDVQLIRSWVWSAGHPQTQIDLNFNDGFGIAAHQLRNAWRLYQWKSFLKTQRHEVPELAHIADNVILTIDWKKLRNLIKTSPSMRSVSVGALLSPAAVARNPRSPFDDRCIWGEWAKALSTKDLGCFSLGLQLRCGAAAHVRIAIGRCACQSSSLGEVRQCDVPATDNATFAMNALKAIIDTGATESVCGVTSMARMLDSYEIPTYHVVLHDRPMFRFGNGQTQQATSRLDIETKALRMVSFYLLDGHAELTPPLLGGRELWDRSAVVAYMRGVLCAQVHGWIMVGEPVDSTSWSTCCH